MRALCGCGSPIKKRGEPSLASHRLAPRSSRALGVMPTTASNSPGSNSPLKVMRFTCAFLRHDHIEQQACIAIDQAGDQRGAGEIDDLDRCGSLILHLCGRAHALDLAALDENRGPGTARFRCADRSGGPL